ncbi:MAG: ATP-binding cassette domain-containing protein [Alphaproteobacteria bacterium]|nr:ATP-binding cassette domain-containing protein [Alphaproteobacteria bacterium]
MLQVENLTKHYPARGRGLFTRDPRRVRAVDGVSFEVKAGEVVAVVGESGCGKSTLGRLAIRLLEPTSGSIRLGGTDITSLKGEALREIRLTAQIVFQDPFGSLNPRMTVGASIAYPLRVNRLFGRADGAAIARRVDELLERVGLNAAHARRLPHELSGGQRQRVGIARAIAVNPKLLVLDEPVAALDLSAQARVLNLFKELQREMGMAYLFITHDLSVAEYMADRILVMYAGKLVETGGRLALFQAPRHPYTQALFSAAMLRSGRASEETILEGDPPSPIDPLPGCRFNTRCPHAGEVCRAAEPAMSALDDGHGAACHLLTGKLRRSG